MRKLRELLEKHRLLLANTFYDMAGPTYRHYTGYMSRLDFCILPVDALSTVKTCTTLRKMARALQVVDPACGFLRDHIPVYVEWQTAYVNDTPQRDVFRWDRDKLMAALHGNCESHDRFLDQLNDGIERNYTNF